MSFAIPPKARILVGATTVGVFLLVGLSLLTTQKILAGFIFLLAGFRFVLLIQQIRSSRRQKQYRASVASRMDSMESKSKKRD